MKSSQKVDSARSKEHVQLCQFMSMSTYILLTCIN